MHFNFECLHPTISHMHLVAEFFKQQAKCVRTISIVCIVSSN